VERKIFSTFGSSTQMKFGLGLKELICMTILTASFIFLVVNFAQYTMVTSGGKSQYLYYGGEDTEDVGPVIDYVRRAGVPSDYVPDFLTTAYTKNRIVEFYSPWCPHCRHFKPNYIQVAKNVASKLDIEFHAVSCVANKELCKMQEIHAYPSIKAFEIGSSKGQAVKRSKRGELLIENIVQAFPGVENITNNALSRKHGVKGNKAKSSNIEKYSEKIKRETYSDAESSFLYALSYGIFMDKHPLKSDRFIAFHDWLEFVQSAIPPEWDMMRNVVSHVFDEITIASQGDKELSTLVKESVEESVLSKGWSYSCTKGESGMGYTCGLWQLFHILSVGYVERYNEVHGLISMPMAGQRLRNYIEQFFGCEVCRTHFLKTYDACAYNRCSRLSDKPTADPREFALWLWEVHNAVNIRLLIEAGIREDRVISNEEKWSRYWPSKELCNQCWGNKEWPEWNNDEVYLYLKESYWYVLLAAAIYF